jgi:hypothetical protein
MLVELDSEPTTIGFSGLGNEYDPLPLRGIVLHLYNEQMNTVTIALLVRPFVLLFLAFFVFAPAVYAVKRWMPEGRLKRLLLTRVN